jgi:MoxR-like ATPase
VSLSGRVRVREGSTRTAEDVIRELWNDVFGSTGTEPGKGGAPTGATISDR